MAGAGGTGPQTQQQPDQMDDLREQLVQAITNQLHGGEPTAPQYQPAQASPQQGFAMARNPQLAPMINQSIQAPGMAQYEQQKMAFEQAMSGRHDAMQSATSLLSSQNRASGIGGRPAMGTIIDEKGNRVLVNIYRGPDGKVAGVEEVGQNPWAPTVMPGMEIDPVTGKPNARILRVPKGGGAATAVSGVGGTTIEPQPPPGLAAEAGGKAGVLGRLPEVMQVFNEAAQSVGGSESAWRQAKNWALSKAAQTSGGPIVAPPELVNYYSSVKSVLFPIIKAGSGMVFPEAELERWEARFPIPGVDPPNVAEHKWDVLIGEMTSDIRAKYGAVGRTPPVGAQQTESIVDKALRLAEERRRANPR